MDIFSNFEEERKAWQEDLNRRSAKEHAKLKIGEIYWAPNGNKYEIVVYLGVVEKPRMKPKNAKVLYNNSIVEFWPEELIEVTEQDAKNGQPSF
jgi:hypothetical protein